MKKIHDTKFTIYIFDKNEASLNTDGFLTNKDVSEPADFYAVIKIRKTKETVGKARINIDEEVRKKFNKKKCFDNFKTTKIILYDFKENLTEKQKRSYLESLTQWCALRTIETISLDNSISQDFKKIATQTGYRLNPDVNEYQMQMPDNTLILILTIIEIILFIVSGFFF